MCLHNSVPEMRAFINLSKVTVKSSSICFEAVQPPTGYLLMAAAVSEGQPTWMLPVQQNSPHHLQTHRCLTLNSPLQSYLPCGCQQSSLEAGVLLLRGRALSHQGYWHPLQPVKAMLGSTWMKKGSCLWQHVDIISRQSCMCIDLDWVRTLCGKAYLNFN